MDALPQRKPTRLREYDYATAGAYFITVCTAGRKPLLATVDAVGDDAHIVPHCLLSEYGRVCDKCIRSISTSYVNVSVDTYVIMPNHIHLGRGDVGIAPYGRRKHCALV